MPRVTFCNWCPVPTRPSPMHHPDGGPRHLLAPRTWAATADRLRRLGWETLYLPCDGEPPYLWRSPDGVSGSGYRSGSPDAPPEAVMRRAHSLGHVDFLHLG